MWTQWPSAASDRVTARRHWPASCTLCKAGSLHKRASCYLQSMLVLALLQFELEDSCVSFPLPADSGGCASYCGGVLAALQGEHGASVAEYGGAPDRLQVKPWNQIL